MAIRDNLLPALAFVRIFLGGSLFGAFSRHATDDALNCEVMPTMTSDTPTGGMWLAADQLAAWVNMAGTGATPEQWVGMRCDVPEDFMAQSPEQVRRWTLSEVQSDLNIGAPLFMTTLPVSSHASEQDCIDSAASLGLPVGVYDRVGKMTRHLRCYPAAAR